MLRIGCALLSATLSLPGTAPVGLSRVGPSAAVGPYDVYEAKLVEAESAATAGQPAEAVASYRDAYESLPAQDRAGDFGTDIVTRVAELTQTDAFRTQPDPAVLDSAIALMERHLEDLERFAPDRDATATRASLADLIAIRDAAKDPAPEPEPPPQPETPVEPVVPEPPLEPDPVPQPSRRPLGVGLIVGGSVALLGGIGMLAYGGWWFGRTNAGYRRELGDLGPGVSSPELNTWRDGEYLPARVFMATGAIVGAVGIGLVIGGAIVLARDGQRETAWVPLIAPDGAGLSVRGRF